MLARRTPLKRRTRIKARRSKPRRSSRVRDSRHLERVRGLPCLMRLVIRNPITDHLHVEAHHASIDHGLGAKGSDYDAVPLCRRCHREWTSHAGAFKNWTKVERRTVAARWIAYTRCLLGLTSEPTP